MPNAGDEILAEHLTQLNAVALVARASGAQSITSGVLTQLQFAAADLADTDGMHDPVTNNTRATIVRDGWHLFIINPTWGSNATGERTIEFYRTRASVQTQIFFVETENPCATAAHRQQLVALDQALVGDYYEAYVYQTSGTAKLITAATLAVIRLGS